MDFIKNPQTTIALTFLTHIISSIDGVILVKFLLGIFQKCIFLTCGRKNITMRDIHEDLHSVPH